MRSLSPAVPPEVRARVAGVSEPSVRELAFMPGQLARAKRTLLDLLDANAVARAQAEARGEATSLNAALNARAEAEAMAQVAALASAKGVVFMTKVKAGFLFSGTVAAGFIVCRTSDGRWSAPSSLGAAGMGVGMQLGAQTTDVLIALDSYEAVDGLIRSGRMSFGGDAHYTVPQALTGQTPSQSHGGASHRAMGGQGVTAYSRSQYAATHCSPMPSASLPCNPRSARPSSLSLTLGHSRPCSRAVRASAEGSSAASLSMASLCSRETRTTRPSTAGR